MTPDDQSHEPIQELLPAVALGTASPAEVREVERHVAGCAACRNDLAALRDAAGVVGLATPGAPVPDLSATRARLLARIAHEPAPPRRVPLMRVQARPPFLLLATAAAAILLLAAGAIRFRSVVGERSALEARLAALQDSLASAGATIAALTGPEVRVVNLASAATRRPSGRMFWDPRTGRWTLVAHDLPALRTGRTYQLWIITTEGRKISAGTFAPVGGNALVQAAYALPGNALGAIAVTEEPAGGVPQPTGEIVISGAAG
jgi:hypothetical protein